MDKSRFKIYILVALILIFVMIIFFVLTLFRPKREEVTPPTDGISPTLGERPTSFPSGFPPAKKLTPAVIHPTGFTGVKEEELPTDVKNLAEQKQALKRNVPLTQAQFTIEFDFATDKFNVTLKEPKDQAQADFTDWLKANYPAIPLDRFTFK